MTDMTELEVTQRAREAAADMQRWRAHDKATAAEDAMSGGLLDDNYTVQAFASFERDILATRTTDPTPVAKVRVKHGGYGMELATYVAYGLPEGDHWLYAHPPAVPANGLVEALEALLHQLVEVGGNPRIEANIGKGLDAAFDNATQALAAYRGEA